MKDNDITKRQIFVMIFLTEELKDDIDYMQMSKFEAYCYIKKHLVGDMIDKYKEYKYEQKKC